MKRYEKVEERQGKEEEAQGRKRWEGNPEVGEGLLKPSRARVGFSYMTKYRLGH